MFSCGSQKSFCSVAIVVLLMLAITLAANAAPITPCSLALTINLFPSYNVTNFPADCSLSAGGVTLNFSAFAVSNGSPASPVVLLANFVQNGNEYTLNFNPQMTQPGQDTSLYERWTIVGGSFQGVDLHDIGQGQNFAITENICAGAPGATPCTGTLAQLLIFNFGVTDQRVSDFAAIPGGASVLSIVKDINLPTAHHGTITAAALSGFSQTFVVPEPVSFVLFGSGLVAVGVLRRRAKR